MVARLARLILFSLFLALVVCTVLLLHGCAAYSAFIEPPRGWPLVCRHTALICAVAAEEQGYEALVVVGDTPRGNGHAQAKAKIDGKWVWLRWNRESNEVDYRSNKQDDFKPEREVLPSYFKVLMVRDSRTLATKL